MLCINHVNKTLKDRKVLNDICVTFERGKIYGLRGINGSGKTMLMRMAAGLIFPDSGSVSIDGKQLGKDLSFPEKMGVLIENPAFLNAYTGRSNLELLNSLSEEAHPEDVETALLRVGLDPEDRRKYRKYSLGMKQRLGIAAAIMGQPDLLLLDEPINALDEGGIDLFEQIIQQEKDRGAMILVTCHDDERLRRWSDVIVEVVDGRIVSLKEAVGHNIEN